MIKTKTFKKNDWIKIKMHKAYMQKRGWELISEEEFKGFSGSKSFFLGLLFLPLALFGSTGKIKFTWEKK